MKTKIKRMSQNINSNWVNVEYKSGARRVVGLADWTYKFTKTQRYFLEHCTKTIINDNIIIWED